MRLKKVLFFRQETYSGCEKINDVYCVCFVQNIQPTEISNITQAIEIYRNGVNNIPTNNLTVMRPRDILILTEFFARYGSIIRQ